MKTFCIMRARKIVRIIRPHIDALCVLLIIIFSSFNVFYNLGQEPYWKHDEFTYAGWAWNMFKTGDYLRPATWYGDTCMWIAKPPLYMWLTVLTYHALSVTDFESFYGRLASRFWSAFFGVLTCLVVYCLGKMLFNRCVGLIAAFVLNTFVGFMSFAGHGARYASLDVTLTFFLLSSIYFYILSTVSNSKRHIFLSGIFLGLALMTKYVAALFAIMIVGLYLIIKKKSVKFLMGKRFTTFWLVGSLIFIPWIAYMHLRFGSAFWQEYFVYQIFERATQPIEGHTGDYLYYFTTFATHENKLWLFILPLSVSWCLYKRGKGDKLVLIWIAIVLGIATLFQTKIYWYITPVFPVFSIAIGRLLDEFLSKLTYLFHSKKPHIILG